MKQKIFLLFFIIYYSFIYAQEKILIEYDFKENQVDYHSYLEIQDTISRFVIDYSDISLANKRIEAVNAQNPCEDCGIQKIMIFPGKKTYYYNFGNTTYSHFTSLQNEFFTKEEPQHNWKLGDSIKTILGYTCQNAFVTFKGRDYEAFFTKDLPFTFGPWKFSGLSGAILEVRSLDAKFSFTAVAIKDITKENNSLISAEFEKEFKKKKIIPWETYFVEVNAKLLEKNKFMSSSEVGEDAGMVTIGETIENVFNETTEKIKAKWKAIHNVHE